MKFIPNLIAGFTNSSSSDGIRVKGRANGFLTLELRHGARNEMRAVPLTSNVRATCQLDGTRSVLRVDFSEGDSWEFAPGQEQLCRDSYQGLMAAISRKPRPWWQIGAVAFAALFIVFILVPISPVAQVAPAPAAQVDQSAFPAGELAPSPASLVLDASEMEQVRAAGAATGIAMRSGGIPFYVFSDPSCPFCVELERSLGKIDPAYQPIVLPLGLKPGSREIAAAAVCAKDKAKAWTGALLEGKAGGEVCAAGLAAVDANDALFRRLSLNSTPTMISPKGLIIVGSGSPERIGEALSQ